jgi:hypothetical protein
MTRSAPIPPKPAEIPKRQVPIPPKPTEIPKRQVPIPPKPAEIPIRQAPVPPKIAEIPARQASGSSRPVTLSESSYKPTEHTSFATSVIPSFRHSDLRQHLEGQRTERRERASVEKTPRRAQRPLIFSPSAESRADDSERVIAALRQEVSQLKKAAKDMSTAKERPRKGLQKSDRERSGASLNVHPEDWAETSSRK